MLVIFVLFVITYSFHLSYIVFNLFHYDHEKYICLFSKYVVRVSIIV